MSYGGWLRSAGDTVDYAENQARNTGRQVLSSLSKIDKGINSQARGFFNSFDFDDEKFNNPVNGEAVGLHPNTFIQFTPARWIGVSRLPVTATKAGRYIYKNRSTIKSTWNQIKNLKNIKNGKQIKKPKNPLPRTTSQLKKSPRVTGTITGTTLGTILASTLGKNITQQKDSTEDLITTFVQSRKKHNQWGIVR